MLLYKYLMALAKTWSRLKHGFESRVRATSGCPTTRKAAAISARRQGRSGGAVAVYDSPDRQRCKGYRIPLGPQSGEPRRIGKAATIARRQAGQAARRYTTPRIGSGAKGIESPWGHQV